MMPAFKDTKRQDKQQNNTKTTSIIYDQISM